jgi:hypothetical protein
MFCNHDEKRYDRFVECDTLHSFRGANSFELVMYKNGKKIENPDFHSPVRALLIEQGNEIERFEFMVNADSEPKNREGAMPPESTTEERKSDDNSLQLYG